MRQLLVLVLVLVGACSTSTEHFPIGPGGGNQPGAGGGGGGVVDASTDGADAMVGPITGRVCLVTDLRGLDCATTGAGSIVVELGQYSATTTTDGSFTMPVTPSDTGLVWRASAANIEPSLVPVSLTSAIIPAITKTRYEELLVANNTVQLSPGQGSIVFQLVSPSGAIGATATTTPAAAFPTRYDGADPIQWDTDATGAAARIWIAGAAEGATTIQITPLTGTAITTTQLVEAGAITFGTIEVP
ncbi:MAG: hypothetical protein H6Q90_2377 [Deltaproteobacteria bacterium]|nr:hypothetical protein [Deltaproteobacteria bacterium]